MPCERVRFPNGAVAIVCSRGRRTKRCACGAPAERECDWKTPRKKSGTCDAPLCLRCTHVPAPEKDLCPKHAAEWAALQTATRDRAVEPKQPDLLADA